MPLSLRTRLTLWHLALLTIALVAFTSVVLLAQWRLLLRQTDGVLEGLSNTAANIVAEEAREHHDALRGAQEGEAFVGGPGRVLAVYDTSGHPLSDVPAALRDAAPADGRAAVRTVTAPDGTRWRVAMRPGRIEDRAYVLAVGVSLEDAVAQWQSLRRATLAGLVVVLALAGLGSVLLASHGLRPLKAMALQARGITADTAGARLTVPPTRDELAHLGESFNRVLDRLGRALDERQRFMADASHELRTPVSTIRTAVEVTLSRPDRDAAEYREALETVAQQGSRLARLVDDMLVLARADAGGYRLVVSDVDVGDVAADCVRELTPLSRSRRVALTNDARRGIFLRGDETLLRRLLLNLVTNAILYTPPGGRATIACEAGADVCELHVSDTGPGIPADDQERIFQRFIRLNPARGADGVGLGLAIARWIAESHGGTLRIAYSGATGTRFTASLPCLEPVADELNSREGAA